MEKHTKILYQSLAKYVRWGAEMFKHVVLCLRFLAFVAVVVPLLVLLLLLLSMFLFIIIHILIVFFFPIAVFFILPALSLALLPAVISGGR